MQELPTSHDRTTKQIKHTLEETTKVHMHGLEDSERMK